MEELLEEELQDDPVDVELDRFSACARAVLDHARTEAQGLGDPFVGTDHLLIALTSAGCGAASRVLTSLNVDSGRALSAIRFIRGVDHQPADPVPDLAHSPRLSRVLEGAAKDAAKRNHVEIGTLHLLAGILREREGLCVLLLESPGMGLSRAGAAIAAAHRDGFKDE